MIWITFVGEGRSGHTAVSGILGSHPFVRLSEEQKYVSKWRRGYTKDEITGSLLSSGKGKYRSEMGFTNLDSDKKTLIAIGDKCGWDAVNEVQYRKGDTRILSQFGEAMEMPVKVIHTTRHPLDNIASWVNSPKYLKLHGGKTQLRMIRRYSRFYEAAEKVMDGQDVFHLRNEELIRDPRGLIIELVAWLGLPACHPWIDDVVKLISPDVHRGRDEVEWDEGRKQQVLGRRIIGSYPCIT